MTRGGIFPRCTSWGGVYYDYEGDPSSFLLTDPIDPEDVIPVEENDIIIIGLVHKGTGWAVFPDGFSLVCREISGSTRGEVYWKRAGVSEVVNYAITGMADTCASFMIVLGGCVKTGSPIAASAARANAAGSSGTAGVTTTVDNSLIFSIGAIGANKRPSGPDYMAIANLPIMLYEGYYFNITFGTDCNLASAYQMMPDYGDTGATSYLLPTGGAVNVGICFALTPDPTEVALTYNEQIATPCTNTTEGTAKVIPSLPYTLVESMEDGTQDLYFKFTPTANNLYYIHPWVSPCYGQYEPATDVYYYSGVTKVYLYTGRPLGNFLDSFQKLLSPGVTYYIHLMNVSGYELDQTGIEFILQILQLSTSMPSVVPHIGDLWIPDDTSWYPAALINPVTKLVRGYYPYPAGERADTIESGYQLTEDRGNRRYLLLYDPEINLVATIGPLTTYNLMGLQIYGGYSDYFWVSYFTTNNTTSPYLLKTINIDGSIGAKTWVLPRPVTGVFPLSVCVNPEGTIAYYTQLAGGYAGPNYEVICRYDLVNEIALSSWSGPNDYSAPGDRAFIMQDGTVFIPYNNRKTSTNGLTSAFIRRYDTDGSVLQDYDFDGYIIDRMCLDFNEDYFWVWCFDNTAGWYSEKSFFFHVKASDGSIDNQFFTYNQQDGSPVIGAGPETGVPLWDTSGDIYYNRPSIGTYGYTSDSCPMFVIRVGLPPDDENDDVEPCFELEGCDEPFSIMVEDAN